MQNDSPKYNVVIGKLCLYFKQDLNYKDNLHPLAEAAYEWMTRNIPERELDNFYTRIITHCAFFPKVTELSSLYQNFIPENKTDIPARIECDENLSEQSLAKNFLEKEIFDPPKHDGKIEMKDLLEWDLKLSTNEMLKRFGYEKCSEVWKHIGEKEMIDHYPDSLKKALGQNLKPDKMEYIHD